MGGVCCCGKKRREVDPYAGTEATHPEPPPRSTTTGSSGKISYSTLIPASEPEASLSDTQRSTQKTESVRSANESKGKTAHLAPSEASTKGTGASGALTKLQKSTASTKLHTSTASTQEEGTEGGAAPSELVQERPSGPGTTQLSSQRSKKDSSHDHRSQEPSSQGTTQNSETPSHSSFPVDTTTSASTVGQSSNIHTDSGRASP